MLRNSCPSTISPTFSFPPTLSHISLLKSSLPPLTDIRTYPHSSPTPCSLRWNSIPLTICLLVSPLCFRSPAGPSVCRSPFLSRMFSSLDSTAAPHLLCSTSSRPNSLLSIIPLSISLSHWLSDVEAYPESYLELRFPLHSVLYKVTRPLICSLASSTQFSLVSSHQGLP